MAMKKNLSLPFWHQSRMWRFRARCVRVSGYGGGGGCGRGHELGGCGGGELQPKKEKLSHNNVTCKLNQYILFRDLEYLSIKIKVSFKWYMHFMK